MPSAGTDRRADKPHPRRRKRAAYCVDHRGRGLLFPVASNADGARPPVRPARQHPSPPCACAHAVLAGVGAWHPTERWADHDALRRDGSQHILCHVHALRGQEREVLDPVHARRDRIPDRHQRMRMGGDRQPRRVRLATTAASSWAVNWARSTSVTGEGAVAARCGASRGRRACWSTLWVRVAPAAREDLVDGLRVLLGEPGALFPRHGCTGPRPPGSTGSAPAGVDR